MSGAVPAPGRTRMEVRVELRRLAGSVVDSPLGVEANLLLAEIPDAAGDRAPAVACFGDILKVAGDSVAIAAMIEADEPADSALARRGLSAMPWDRRCVSVRALFAITAILLLTHSQALAQTVLLQFLNPLILTIAGGSGSTSSQVNVTLSTGGSPSSLSIVSTSVNTGSNWLCAGASGNVLTVSVGTSCAGYNSQLTAGAYSGVVNFTSSQASNAAQLQVNLIVTSVGAGPNGLVAAPSTLTFNVAPFSGVTTQNFSMTLNGAPEQITGVSWSTVSGQGWLSASSPFNGSLAASVNTAFLSSSSDLGSILVTTPAGQIIIPVSISTTGGSTSGPIASPNSLSFNLAVGVAPTQQSFTVQQNGSPLAITGLTETTTTGANWLQPFISGSTGRVTVQVNPSSPTTLQAGTYSGTVVATTSAGPVQVAVTLNVGSGGLSGLSASVNPLVLSLPQAAGISTQDVNITLNGQPITLTGVSSSTTTGQAWLTASVSAVTGQVVVTANPVNLSGSATYQGSVFANTTAGSVSFGVTLNLGSGSGPVASPSSVNFNIPLLGAGVSPQNVNITLNGVAEPIQSVSHVLNSGQNWLLVASTGTGIMTVSTNGAAFTTAGTYTATISVITLSGTVTIPVSVTVATGAISGLAASPNPLTVNVPIGSGISSQMINVTNNGVPVSITGVSSSTTTSQSWLQVNIGSQQGTVLVAVNQGALATSGANSYSGTVFISTSAGQLSVPVNLNTGGLSASPNPVNIGGGAGGAFSQNVSILYNSFPITVSGLSAITTTGQNWLVATFTPAIPGIVTVTANPSVLSAGGTYTGVVSVTTPVGRISFQVYLTFGPLARAIFRDASGSIQMTTFPSGALSDAGGAFASDPAMAEDSIGNVFVAARDGSNAVWSNVFSSITQTWTGWQTGGGSIQGVPSIAAAQNGTAWIAARDSANSYWLLSYSPGAGYGAWTPLAGAFTTDPVVTACPDGSLYLVGKDSSNALWSGQYIPGTLFAGFILGGGAAQGKPSISCGTDNAVYIAARDSVNSNWVARVSGATWTGWFNGGAATSIDPRIASLSGSMAVAILDTGGTVWWNTFNQGTGNGWQTWTGVGGSLQDISAAGVNGQLFFAGRALNGDLWWWQQTGSQWTWIGNNGVAAGALAASPR